MLITNLSGSGAERVTLNLAEMFIEYGHRVDLFLLENYVALSVHPAINLHALAEKRQLYKWLGALGDRLLANKLRTQIDKLTQSGTAPYDLFLSHLPAADKVVSHCRIPNTWHCIHTSYSGEIEQFRRQNRGVRAFRKQRLYRSLYQDKKLVAVSTGVAEDLVKHLHIQPKTIRTIFNPFDFEQLRNLSADKSASLPDFEFILHAGAFRPVKRHDLLLEAFFRIKTNIKLILLADPSPGLSDMIQKLGLQDTVLILGHHENPYPFLQAAKLLVLCSDREGLPTVIIESLILGTAVVSTDCPSGPREILTGDLKEWLVPINNPVALANKIDKALNTRISIKDTDIVKFGRDQIYVEYKKLITKS